MDLQAIELFDMHPAQLDSFLSIGWFRIQQTIFTTDVLCFNEEAYTPVWLRVRLRDFVPDKKYKILQKKNRGFKMEIKKAIVTPEHEALYASYKESVAFDCAPNLHWLLYGDGTRDVYNTYMINMFDGNKLAGAGFFDLGNNSAAGICSVYNPAYKKCSPGRYLIYEKMLYCKDKNFKYFYPGYFVPGYPMFDYKLEIGKDALEYFNSYSKKWFPLIQKK